jgi:hypothetical protein
MRAVRALSALLLAAGLAAQEEASTLYLLAGQARMVVVADVMARTDPDPGTHETRFQTVLALKGSPAAQFALREPAGPCCGRALEDLQVTARAVLFLTERDGMLQPCAGVRGVAAPDAATVQHVRALLAAGPGAGVLPVLAAGLQSPVLRVRRDAGMALAYLPALGNADAAVRAAIATATTDLLARDEAQTDAPYLVSAASRLQLVEVLPALAQTWVRAGRADLRSLVQGALPHFPPAAAASATLAAMTDEEGTRVRAADLLACLPPADARGPLLQLLRNQPTTRVQLAACRVLLAHGASAADLQGLVPAAVLDAVPAVPPRPKLRNVTETPR